MNEARDLHCVSSRVDGGDLKGEIAWFKRAVTVRKKEFLPSENRENRQKTR